MLNDLEDGVFFLYENGITKDRPDLLNLATCQSIY